MSLKWYSCQKCKTIIKKDKHPSAIGCTIDSFHWWIELGVIGKRNYQCSHCGITIQTKGIPFNVGCSASLFHTWIQLENIQRTDGLTRRFVNLFTKEGN